MLLCRETNHGCHRSSTSSKEALFWLVGILAVTLPLKGQPGKASDTPDPAKSSSIRGILEVDPKSGAVSLYFSMGPGLGHSTVRYLPALVGRFAPSFGVRQQSEAGGGAGPELALLAATGFELSPGHLDLPLIAPDAGMPGPVITWTYLAEHPSPACSLRPMWKFGWLSPTGAKNLHPATTSRP